jgi:cytochrome b subunit of formate dehydrogenase
MYVRFNKRERVQHYLLIVSFITLVWTGFALRWPDRWWAFPWQVQISEGWFLRGLVHRIAGVVMIGASVFHVFYLAGSRRGREQFMQMRPVLKDVWDAIAQVRWSLRSDAPRPRFPRFSYIEKAEYWALVWGTVIMAGTGLLLWFSTWAVNTWGATSIEVARAIHFYEAILAALAIVIWHFYSVLINPDIYPMNWTWLTGRLTREEMIHEHPDDPMLLDDEAAASPEGIHPSEAGGAELFDTGGEPPLEVRDDEYEDDGGDPRES